MQVSFYNSLRFKIGFGYIVLVLINVGVTLWTIYNFGRLSSALSVILNQNYPNVIVVENMARSIERHEHAVRTILNSDVDNGKVELSVAKEEYTRTFDKAGEQSVNELTRAILVDIHSTYEGYNLLIDSLIHLVVKKEYENAKTFHYNNLLPFYQRLSDNCFWLIEENQKSMTNVSQNTKEISNDAIIAILTALLMALILSIVTIVQFSKRVILPAEKLTKTVNQIGRGQLDLKIDVQSNDEFGLLSREFNKMTERLRKFEALNIEKILAEKKKSETIVASISDAIVVCDAQKTVQHLNEAAEKLFHYRQADVIGKHIEELTSDIKLSKILQEDEDLTALPFIEFSVRGKSLFVRPRTFSIINRSGEREGTVFVLQDVTQFKELDKMKSEFMATVSHEFRTPVTSINMGVDILRQRLLGPLTKAQEGLLESFKQDCERLTKLVRDLLQLSKLESGKIQLRNDVVDVKRLIEITAEQLQLQFREKGITLNIILPERIPTLIADEQQLSWVISNLMNNALKHTTSGGTVTVVVEVQGDDGIIVHVQDTGKGIPEEFIDKVFDKFVQVKPVNDPTPGSVGLGLSIAKDIVELYGGKIWVESEVDKGTTFTFELPIKHGIQS